MLPGRACLFGVNDFQFCISRYIFIHRIPNHTSMRRSRKTIRLQDHDYRVGSYFVTICTRKRVHFFGEIVNHKMSLSAVGEFVERAWHEIPQHFSHVDADEFVVMPNHLHGILHLDDSVVVSSGIPFQENYFGGPLPGSLSLVIQQFKTVVTKWARSEGHTNFGWQAKFHDRWIRNEKDLPTIGNYIYMNPIRWEEDEFNGGN